jgi:hypothetical protein
MLTVVCSFPFIHLKIEKVYWHKLYFIFPFNFYLKHFFALTDISEIILEMCEETGVCIAFITVFHL